MLHFGIILALSLATVANKLSTDDNEPRAGFGQICYLIKLGIYRNEE